jgi:hypothetical protein
MTVNNVIDVIGNTQLPSMETVLELAGIGLILFLFWIFNN